MYGKITRRIALALSFAMLAGPALAADRTVTIGYQTDIEPSKIAQAEGRYEKASGWKINWRKFSTGAEVIAAMASGDVQVGFTGSSPLAAGITRGLPLQTFFIAAEIGSAEALVVRNGSNINSPQDLIGKKIAVPFVSTTHYSLLAALKHWNISPQQVTILNLAPPEIAAAWQRGDIDAAYIWDPALGKVAKTGRVLTTSAEVRSWGSPTFLAWVARNDFAQAHPDFLVTFAKVTGEVNAEYRKDGANWAANSPQVREIARISGSDPADVPALLRGTTFPLLSEQSGQTLLGGGTATALADTSRFLKDQKRIDEVLPDYRPTVTASVVQQAIGH
ncbi:taurine ABC transporter substrate-binding protein [Paraburkholderia saeva]|uniref:Taurine-binding periplasmic protein n=1 Tax=Paraburkholderia saeva TaxID=2777537 RepID=A0A9N8X232_9BURK|nr:taurine ABC transporter substrate-binding protein [Paraburkholderia saeva]CAG4898341.1 Taurine-binding periplasmic protein [Paraburkholderia saeva]CAG4900684.1 Taurine-binding periplasmic protein [Paraburkholderia saeva]